ncbi:hypothetical protein J437_LFUL003674 [Ladona fulva]|uniref:Protein tipE n=1 Tax=Ladona fulva TaxID=123851 RepID=A0A8K0NVG1_LADFU|nr:hypothetical protein J437_LFUL003674 [Ladona fulva]
MIPEPDEELKQTLREKVLFHVTAFFVLVGIFSLFAFLFLVPFVVDPALSTISAAFDPVPADCVTISVLHNKGNSNCTWASCREGCTRELYICTQLRVDYRRPRQPGEIIVYLEDDEDEEDEEDEMRRRKRQIGVGVESWDERDYENLRRVPRAIPQDIPFGNYVLQPRTLFVVNDSTSEVESDNATMDFVYYSGARVFPNVKGCGYPPVLNCSIWHSKHSFVGSRYPCYYSRVDPGLVITQLDMHAVYMDLVYAVLIPVPSFIISVVYLAFAYFKIYNEDETAPEEGAAPEGEEEGAEEKEGSITDGEGIKEEGKSPMAKSPSGSAGGGSIGGSKGGTEGGVGNGVAGGGSLSGGKAGSPTSGEAVKGNLTKTMTTSITPPPGPIAEV